MPTTPQLFLCCLGLAAVVSVTLSGCKPAPPVASTQQTPLSEGNASHQPTAADFQAFFQSLLPATAKVSDVKMDASARMSNASPGSNAWLLSLKITVTPAEDLFSLPSA